MNLIRMEKYIISDLHGNGNVYDSIMNYIDNIRHEEDVILYINGDLIDRGPDSIRMLLDVKKRIENGENIVYLGGNHEFTMHQVYDQRKNKLNPYYNIWYRNGGKVTDDGLIEAMNYDKSKIFEVSDFVSNLDLYYKFDETIDNKNIVLCHAACPYTVKDTCHLKINSAEEDVMICVWTKKGYPNLDFKRSLGDKNYFTIVGHTITYDDYGYKYYHKGNYLNIDGGSAAYVCGHFDVNHIPLVEVKDEYLRIIVFNNNNEIIYGSYFYDYESIKMNEDELDNERNYLNKNLLVKKLIKNIDGRVYYEDN